MEDDMNKKIFCLHDEESAENLLFSIWRPWYNLK